MLGDDEEFDVRRLEELAESLLADITGDLETGPGESCSAAAEDTGKPERLPGSMVGSTTERLESSGHRTGCLDKDSEDTVKEHSLTVPVLELNGNKQQTEMPVATTTTIKTEAAAPIASVMQGTPDTVYGTYDAKTNSITIVMDGDAVPVNEAVMEIYSDGVTAGDDATDVVMKCPPPATSPSQVYLNVVNATEDSDDESFESFERFLCPRVKAISPLAKSPALSLHSATSDHGYESILGSPSSTPLTLPMDEEDFAWQSNFDELFPSLI